MVKSYYKFTTKSTILDEDTVETVSDIAHITLG